MSDSKAVARRVPALGLARRITATARNAAEVVRFGGLETDEVSSPYTIETEQLNYRLRRYYSDDVPDDATPMLLIPPLMLTTEVWDVSPRSSAVTALHEEGIDTWVVDFGHPEREPGGLERTLTDHVLAVSDAIDRIIADDREGRHPRWLLAGRHVRVPDRGLPARQGHRLVGHVRLACRLAGTAADPAVPRGGLAARGRPDRDRRAAQARAARLGQPARLQAAHAGQVRPGPRAVPAHPARPRRAAAARTPAPFPRVGGLDGVERAGHRGHPRAVPRPQPHARGRVRRGRAAGHAGRHRAADHDRRRLRRHDRASRFGACGAPGRTPGPGVRVDDAGRALRAGRRLERHDVDLAGRGGLGAVAARGRAVAGQHRPGRRGAADRAGRARPTAPQPSQQRPSSASAPPGSSSAPPGARYASRKAWSPKLPRNCRASRASSSSTRPLGSASG